MFRAPKTRNEARASYPVREEGEPLARGKRRHKSLPDAFDDVLRSDLDDRCWKRYRKTQYRGDQK